MLNETKMGRRQQQGRWTSPGRELQSFDSKAKAALLSKAVTCLISESRGTQKAASKEDCSGCAGS